MIVYRGRRIQQTTDSGTTWAEVVPDAAPTVGAYTTAGVLVQTLTATYNATRDRWLFTTTNPLYTSGDVYMARWNVVIDGVTYSVAGGELLAEPYVHYTPGDDTTGPASPSIAVTGVTETTVTLAHTPPTDSDYDNTIIYAIPTNGGAAITATGSGTTITVTGLTAATHYTFIAIAYDTTGNCSTPAAGCTKSTATAITASPDKPLIVKFFVNAATTPQVIYYIDPTDAPTPTGESAAHNLRPQTRGRIHRIRMECHAPIVGGISVRGFGMTIGTRDREPRGHRGSLGE